MKVVAVLLLATAVFGWDDQKVFKKWSNMKAMESCWGEDNMKTYTIQLKKAISKCHGTDAPELELPLYRSPFRFINTIMTSGQQHQEYLMEAVQKMAHNMVSEQNYNMQNMQQQNNQFQGQQFQNNQFQNQQNNQFQQQYMPKNQNQGRNDMYNMNQQQKDNMQSNNMKNMKYDQVMNTVSMMKLLKEYMQVHPQTSQDNYNMENIMQRNTYSNQKDNTNMDFSQELMRRMGGVQQKQNQFRFKRQGNGDTKPQGSDADTLPGFLELGDRLAEKLKDTKEKAMAKMGNFTCVMKEMNILTKENNINARGLKQELEKFNMPSEWFKNHEIKNIDICYHMSEAVPQSVQDDYNYPGYPNLAKMKVFMKCCKESKRQTCMNQDMKNKIENNFGPLEKILEQTGLTETELFPLMKELLYSSEEMEYM